MAGRGYQVEMVASICVMATIGTRLDRPFGFHAFQYFREDPDNDGTQRMEIRPGSFTLEHSFVPWTRANADEMMGNMTETTTAGWRAEADGFFFAAHWSGWLVVCVGWSLRDIPEENYPDLTLAKSE